MHRFQRIRQLRFHRLSAVLWLLFMISVPTAAGLLIAAFACADRTYATLGLSCACVALALALLQRLATGSASCPLCRMPPLASKRCQKNHRARPLLGSYRFRVSLTTVFLNQFRCPYCGETTRCCVRSPRNKLSPDSPFPLPASEDKSSLRRTSMSR